MQLDPRALREQPKGMYLFELAQKQVDLSSRPCDGSRSIRLLVKPEGLHQAAPSSGETRSAQERICCLLPTESDVLKKLLIRECPPYRVDQREANELIVSLAKGRESQGREG
jgi:hypothetical protein